LTAEAEVRMQIEQQLVHEAAEERWREEVAEEQEQKGEQEQKQEQEEEEEEEEGLFKANAVNGEKQAWMRMEDTAVSQILSRRAEDIFSQSRESTARAAHVDGACTPPAESIFISAARQKADDDDDEEEEEEEEEDEDEKEGLFEANAVNEEEEEEEEEGVFNANTVNEEAEDLRRHIAHLVVARYVDCQDREATLTHEALRTKSC